MPKLRRLMGIPKFYKICADGNEPKAENRYKGQLVGLIEIDSRSAWQGGGLPAITMPN
jgi:hypothetical protein